MKPSKDPLAIAHAGVALLTCAVLAEPACGPMHVENPGEHAALGTVTPLGAPHLAAHAYARAGDLVLHGSDGTSLTFAATADAPGHRPVRGALLDVGVDSSDRADPLLWWRPALIDPENKAHPLVARTVSATRCDGGGAGIRVEGDVDAAKFTTTICAETHGRYVATTQVSSLPAGFVLADDFNPGTSNVVIDGDGGAWEGDRTTDFAAISEHGVALLVESPGMRASRKLVHIATESFPSAVAVRYAGTTSRSVLHVVKGDALDAIARLPASTLAISANFGANGAGDAVFQDEAGRELVRGAVPKGASRAFRVPPSFGRAVRLIDDTGVARGPAVAVQSGMTMAPAHTDVGHVELRYVDGKAQPLPLHVMFRGVGETADPTPIAGDRSFAAGRSLYLLDGKGSVALPPGTYEITASHGFTYGLSKRRVRVDADKIVRIDDTLKELVATDGFIMADFHLHAAPSPDAPVSLEQRVASLVCEGVELAAATDHNRITDYGPSVRRLSFERRFGSLAGDEITSAGSNLWGHFIAFPLPLPTGAPEDAVPAYYDLTAGQMFASAREHGARVVQVNHARMPPKIGYFDLTHVDPKSGHADDTFSGAFDAFEAFNGIWLEQPDKVREGARDLVALARRGQRSAATGNSDSHRLLYEEAGYPRTFVRAAAMPVEGRGERAVAGLLAGDTMVSSGPIVEMSVNGKPVGSVIRPDSWGKLRVHVRVSAPAWVPVEHVELWRDDTVAERFAVPGPARDGVRFETDVDLAVERDTVLLAWADADTPLPDVLPYPNARAIGFTGLVYVDADGDGRVLVPPAK